MRYLLAQLKIKRDNLIYSFFLFKELVFTKTNGKKWTANFIVRFAMREALEVTFFIKKLTL